MNRINKILCVLPKYSFGDIKRGISPEYNAIYKPIQKNYKNVFYFDSLKYSNLGVKSPSKHIVAFLITLFSSLFKN